MSARLILMALLSASLAACSGGDSSDNENQPGDDTGIEGAETGTLTLPLTAETSGAKYRLASASFTITGGAITRLIKPPADLPVDTETLPVGDYSILLRPGWV